VSRFYLIWCIIDQESKLRRKFLSGPDISGTFIGYIQSKVRNVRWTFSTATFDDCFERNFLTESLINSILLPLDS
jgi:hypothetical protein